MKTWPKIAVLGAGAVGSYFGGMLARSGAPVVLIGRRPHVDAIIRDGLAIERADSRERVRLAASTDVAAARGAEIVLLCVKTFDTEVAARLLAPHLASGSLLVSLQNGVDNVSRIKGSSGIDAIPSAVYVAVEMTAPGSIRHSGRGDLVIGEAKPGPRNGGQVEAIAALFARAGVPCRLSPDITADLWVKLAMNCAYNPISALSRTRYGSLLVEPQALMLMTQVVRETLDVARACGVHTPDEDELLADVWQLAEAMPQAISSMAQDIAAGKRTEIDALNGFVAQRGLELEVLTPVNRTLSALVRLLEKASRG